MELRELQPLEGIVMSHTFGRDEYLLSLGKIKMMHRTRSLRWIVCLQVWLKDALLFGDPTKIMDDAPSRWTINDSQHDKEPAADLTDAEKDAP